MYYTKNMQTGVQDRTVYKIGDILQDIETGELFQLIAEKPIGAYSSSYILANDSSIRTLSKSTLDIGYDCVGNLAPNHTLDDFIISSAGHLPSKHHDSLAGVIHEIEQERRTLQEAVVYVDELAEKLKEARDKASRYAKHLAIVQASAYHRIQEIRGIS